MRSEEGSCQFSRLKYSEDLYQQIHWPASYDYLEQAGTQNAHRELTTCSPLRMGNYSGLHYDATLFNNLQFGYSNLEYWVGLLSGNATEERYACRHADRASSFSLLRLCTYVCYLSKWFTSLVPCALAGKCLHKGPLWTRRWSISLHFLFFMAQRKEYNIHIGVVWHDDFPIWSDLNR